MGKLFKISLTGQHTCSLALNAGHEIYAAHFPANPITPAACLIDIAAEAIQLDTGGRITVSGVKNAKFLAPLKPTSHCTIELKHGSEGSCAIIIKDSDCIYAKMSVTYLRSDSDL